MPFYRMFTYSYSLLTEKGICDRQNISSFRVFVCTFIRRSCDFSGEFSLSFHILNSTNSVKSRDFSGSHYFHPQVFLNECETFWWLSTVGQTKINIEIRLKEHLRNIRFYQIVKSTLAMRVWDKGYNIQMKLNYYNTSRHPQRIDSLGKFIH